MKKLLFKDLIYNHGRVSVYVYALLAYMCKPVFVNAPFGVCTIIFLLLFFPPLFLTLECLTRPCTVWKTLFRLRSSLKRMNVRLTVPPKVGSSKQTYYLFVPLYTTTVNQL